MGGSSELPLQRILRMLCSNTEWKYAVFWKLKHRPRMVLTLEDAYYEMNGRNDDSAENKCLSKALEKLHDEFYTHDPLGLAVAKMSYHVHSLGEGVVGQVAVSGRHQWIYAENHEMTMCASFENSDGWKNQFSAGIRTIAVVAVVPHGVVQLGSFNKVIENMDLVTCIRDVFMALPDSSIEHVPHPMQSSLHSSLHLQDIPSKSFASEVPDYLHHVHKTLNNEEPDIWFSIFPFLGKDNDNSYILSLPSNTDGMAVDFVNKHGELELPTSGADESAKLLQSKSNIIDLQHHRIIDTSLNEKRKCGREVSFCKDSAVGSGNDVNQLLHESVMGDNNLCNTIVPSENVEVDSAHFPLDLIDSTVCDRVRLNSLDYYQNEGLHASESSNIKFQKNMELQAASSHLGASNASSKFPAGYELHEALGPAFLKKSKCFGWESLKSEVMIPEIPEKVKSSQFTSGSHPEHLLEAVIANVCQNPSDDKSEKSFCKSVQSLLTAENYPEPSSHTTLITDSTNQAIGQRAQVGEETQHCLSSSGVSGVMSTRGFSSCPSAGNEQFERSSAPTKNNKKRARPGENCRPRPRDRQLIQDRIKELRDLIPSGAKCSIDSLLERTIKHMLYLQSITKHADKLNKYSDMKNVQLCQKETSMLEPSTFERGSSWAVEVGGNLKVCSIIVENLNKNGQMVVEMMCEECSHFLEIAEAIKSLGLTILKGVTEAHGEKTWICFVVEGQSNRSLHRMDILWSLVQILQPKNAVQQ